MSSPSEDIEARLRRRPRPGLPVDLKRRVMTAAILASPATSWRDRIWFSRTWRLAAAGTLLAVLALDRWSTGWSPVADSTSGRTAVEELDAVTSLGAEMGMPKEQVRQLAARVEFVQLTAREPRGSVDPALR